MYKARNLLWQISILFFIFALVNSISAQSNDSFKLTHQPTLSEIQINIPHNNTDKEIIDIEQKNLNRTISILNVVATLMGVLVALITIIFVVGIAIGFFEYRKWRGIRKQAEKYKAETEKSAVEAQELYEEIKPILEHLKRAEEEVNNLRKQIQTPPITEKPSEEIKQKLDDYARRVEFLETFGVPLKLEDYYSRGLDFYYKGKYELALVAFDKAIEIKPDYVEAWSNKGVTLGKLGKYDEAVKCFDEAIEIKPDYAEAWYNKGVALGKLGRHEEALKACDGAIKIKPDYAEAWFGKGAALGKLGRHEEALKAFDEAIKIKPDLAEAWFGKGAALGKLGRHEEALKAFDKAIEIKPDDANAWYNKACCYSLMKDKENAIKNLSRAIELDAKFKEIAKKDEDFKNLWDGEDFKKIAG